MEEWSLPARRERVRLENGMELRLLSALEILQARREAVELAKGAEELPLCSNACLLARAMERRGADGGGHRAAVCPVGAAERAGGPGAGPLARGAGNAKKKLRDRPGERLRWRVLRQFRALPTEARAREMKNRDYLWCLAHTLLDREEELERLCPQCRSRAEEERCPVCGQVHGAAEGGRNPAFDPARFAALKGGEA